jgi:hypothetical protein
MTIRTKVVPPYCERPAAGKLAGVPPCFERAVNKERAEALDEKEEEL